MSPISVNIGVPISLTSCPICGTTLEGDQTDRVVEFLRPHLAAERKATVDRIRAAAIKKWNGPGHVLPSELFAILDAEAARGA